MANLSILKGAKRVSVAKTSDKLILGEPSKELQALAADVVLAVTQAKDATAKAEALKDQIKQELRPIQDSMEQSGGVSKTCEIAVADHAVQVQFKNYGAVDAVVEGKGKTPPVNNEEDLRELLGDKFDQFVTRKRTIGINSVVANSDERLSSMLARLTEALGEEGAEQFVAEYLEVREQLLPVASFANLRFTLDPEVREQLEGTYFKRTVAVSVS